MIKLLFILVLLTFAMNASAEQKSPPQVWMTNMRPEVLAEDGAQWDFVKRHVDVMEFYINTLAFYIPAEKLKPLVVVLKENDIKISIECGYFDWKSKSNDFSAPNPKGINDVIRETFDGRVGEETARAEIGKIANLLAAGGTPDYLNLDGSIRRMMRPGQDVSRADVKGFDSLDRSVDELVVYMQTLRRKFPNIQFYMLPNFPNWGWKGEMSYWGGMFNGDYYEALTRIIAKSKAAGIPILGVTVDYPYEYTVASRPHEPWLKYADDRKPTCGPDDPAKIDWMNRLLDLERYVRSQGLRFNLIINAESGNVSSEAFCEGTMKYLEAYRKAGGSPGGYVVQSWYKYPEKVVPETEPHTMTWLTRKVILAVKGHNYR